MKAAGITVAAALLLALSACDSSAAAVIAPSGPASTGASAASQAPTAAPTAAAVKLPGKIAFTRDANIWVFENGAARQLTNVPGAADPDWSPDGKTLAFDRQDKNSADLYVLPYPQGPARALTNNANRVIENNLWEMQPAWSPDATSLAYVSDRDRGKTGTLDPAAWRISVATGARSLLRDATQFAGGIDFPRWRPKHQSELVYTSWTYDPQSLQVQGQLTLDGSQAGEPRALTPAGETALQPAWSPDGSTLAYIKPNAQRNAIWLLTLDDSTSATATPSPAPHLLLQGQFAHPVWSPDGKSIAYLGLKNGSIDLFVQPLNDSHLPDGSPTQITSGWHLEAASAISWGP
ncbi:MAG: PD40 domain-containing protein [Chloroflexi bacterium]|nr:PD40 domain-containing protein [Chloroflexota bacterium]